MKKTARYEEFTMCSMSDFAMLGIGPGIFRPEGIGERLEGNVSE